MSLPNEINISNLITNIQNSNSKNKHNKYKQYTIYKRIGSGAYGVTYGNDTTNIIFKFMFLSPEMDKQQFIKYCNDEVEKQHIASIYNLGPKIYHYGFFENIKSIPYFKNISFYLIEMEYYSENGGWSPVRLFEFEDYKDEMCEFVTNFIKAGLVNNVDPANHFYIHKKHGLRMIDYGNVEYCHSNKENCKRSMLEKLFVLLNNTNRNTIIDLCVKKNNKTNNNNSYKKIKTKSTKKRYKPYGGFRKSKTIKKKK